MRGGFRTLIVATCCVASVSAAEAPVIRPDGVGPIKMGMTVAQLSDALHQKFSMPEHKEDQGCFFVHPRVYPAVMIEDGKVVRVDVDQPGILTAEGVQVGDTEEHAKKVYGPRLKIEPSKYAGDEGGHYLTVLSNDRRYGIRFETEQGKITTFYAGTSAAIQYAEGCE